MVKFYHVDDFCAHTLYLYVNKSAIVNYDIVQLGWIKCLVDRVFGVAEKKKYIIRKFDFNEVKHLPVGILMKRGVR
jgi:hypothetical protein